MTLKQVSLVGGQTVKTCPFCAEPIQAAAVVCKHCGRDLQAGDKRLRRIAIGLFSLIAIIVVLSMLGSLVGPTSQSRSAPAESAATLPPHTIQTWRGTGMKQTERFTTTRPEWRIRWTSQNPKFAGSLLQVYAYDANGAMVALAANIQGPGSDVSYVRSTPGTHYLMISSANIDWVVTVEE